LNGFFSFLDVQCGEEELRAYLDAIERLQTGAITGHEVKKSFAEDELDRNSGRLMPNVRLANGSTSAETRRRLMLTFNSPFFPEVLVARNVLAEGVDLHRFCRYVIHHDLCWSPSTLEQRTGRVDRIGAKVEQCGQPILVYLPYIAETQDEKMYRVVTDRERWFSVVMGHKFATDARTTEHLAQRIPLPETVARPLALRLEVVPLRYANPPTNQPADVGGAGPSPTSLQE
jgi:superfamily II DNA or RNA helicase